MSAESTPESGQQNSPGSTAGAGFSGTAGEPSESFNGFGAASEPPLVEHPELIVGAALVGGFLFGRLVKRLGS